MVDKFTSKDERWLSLEDVILKIRALPRSMWLELTREDQAIRWRSNAGLPVELYLEVLREFEERDDEEALVLICGEVQLRAEIGENPTLAEYQQRFPDLSDSLAIQFAIDEILDHETAAPDSCVEPTSVGELPGYELLEEIGRGASSIVYRARQVSVERDVAIKAILATSLSQQQRGRYEREARILGTIRHPNVVRIYEVIEQGGCFHLVMEYIDGMTLDELSNGTPLDHRVAAELTAKLSEAVHRVHQAGVLHRDLKPGNILITASGEPVITDFGLARWVESHANLTLEPSLVGTPSFMAPEQASGSAEIDVRADVYALGSILYALLTGRPPFAEATLLDTLTSVREREPLRPRKLVSGVPRDLETICLKCLEKSAAKRYQNASELAADLGRFLTGQAILARPLRGFERVYRGARRRPSTAVAALATIAILIVSAAGLATVRIERRQSAAISLLDACQNADLQLLPALLARIDQQRDTFETVFDRHYPHVTPGSSGWLNLALTGSKLGKAACRAALMDYLPQSRTIEIPQIVQQLTPVSEREIESAWDQIEAESANPAAGLRWACFVASHTQHDRRFREVSRSIARTLSRENPFEISQLAPLLDNYGDVLTPLLSEIARDSAESAGVRTTAAGLVSRFAIDNPLQIASLIVDVDADQFRVLLPALKIYAAEVAPTLRAIAGERRLTPAATAEERRRLERAVDHFYRRQATAVLALWHVGVRDAALAALSEGAESELRSWVVHQLADLDVSRNELLKMACGLTDPIVSDPTVKMSLLLAAGDAKPNGPADQATIELLQTLGRTSREPGVLSAVHWLLTQRFSAIATAVQAPHQLATRENSYSGPNGHRFVKLAAPGKIILGSPAEELQREEDEALVEHHIDYDFSLSTTEVTIEQFLRFRAKEFNRRYAPSEDCPANNITFFDAAAYCRWLSEQDAIDESEMCYPPLREIGPGMTMPPNWQHRLGYRLPTEAEWEYACRSGVSAARYFGNGRQLTAEYAWTLHTSDDLLHPVGQLRPNYFGLFDMLGNVSELCHDSRQPSPTLIQASYAVPRRGGDFTELTQNVRAARRYVVAASTEWANMGFRVAQRR